MSKINISNRSINLLRNDEKKRHQYYVRWERDNEFQTYFSLGATFASCMESRAKTWDYQIETHAKRMEQDFINGHAIEDYPKYLAQLSDLIENAKVAIKDKPQEAEKQTLVPINDKYQLKAKMDAFYGDHIVDHKTVTLFTKEEEQEEKYIQQAMIYQYAVYKDTGNKLPLHIIEIKKWKPTLPTKKDDLIAMLTPEQKKQAEWYKVKELRNLLYACATKEQVSQTIVFEWDDSIITRVENLIRKAVLKADRVRELDSEDIL